MLHGFTKTDDHLKYSTIGTIKFEIEFVYQNPKTKLENTQCFNPRCTRYLSVPKNFSLAGTLYPSLPIGSGSTPVVPGTRVLLAPTPA